ncbi:MAG: hypothetical protein ABJE95_35135 [Byssovorax sp.]
MPRRQPQPAPVSSSPTDAYADHDDADSIAHAMAETAVADREWSLDGLLRSLSHKASHEDGAFPHCVIDPEFIDILALRKEPGAVAILESSLDELRRWLDASDVGKQQRARYALVRFLGPEADVAVDGLRGSTTAQTAVLHALDNPIAVEDDDDYEDKALSTPFFPTLPASLLPGLRVLLDPKATRKRVKAGSSWRDFARIVRVLLRIDSDEVSTLLLAAVEIDELRPALLEQLAASPGGRRVVTVSAQVQERFERAAAILEKSRTAGLPSRVEMAVAGAIAAIVGRNREMAKRAVQIFDLVPGFNASPEPLVPLVRMIIASIDFLDASELAHLASFMVRAPEERLPAAAAAWVRLDPARAKQLSLRFNEGAGPVAAKRWIAAARAHMEWKDRAPAIGLLIPESALGAAAKGAPIEITRPLFESLIRKARTSAELAAAVTGAAASADQALLRPVLEKLRDVPFRIDKTFEALLVPLIGPDNEDRVQDEIDGENPFRDRRDALARALAASRAQRSMLSSPRRPGSPSST